MAKNHGARQQKKAAKQKAKRLEKRSELIRRTSNDPSVRFQRAAKWPVVHALVGKDLWDKGLGQMVLARQESEGRLVFGVYLVNVYCLGVKNAFWHDGTAGTLRDVIQKIEEVEELVPIAPACLVKILQGAVEYARTYGFRPHPDFRHASMLLEGIDPSTCPEEFEFGRDGKPFYIRGPHESLEQARVISERIHSEGGDYLIPMPESELEELEMIEEEEDDPEALPGP